jgi:hypothetical protein
MTYELKNINLSFNEPEVKDNKYDIEFVSGVKNPGHETARFYGYCVFKSMEHLLHYFNLLAMPENQSFSVPSFNMNLIQCINWSDNSIIFRNREAMEAFVEVVYAEVTSEEEA